jgi:hypothetical protein
VIRPWSALRRALPAAVLAVVVVIVAWAARVSEGRRSLAASDAALRRQDRAEAIVQARAAAEARCPFCEAPELGYGRLYAIARSAENIGDDRTAVEAWQAVRAATLATSVQRTSSTHRERADREIARLAHRIDVAMAAGNPSPAASEERLRSAFADAWVPSGTVFALVALGGALLGVGAVRFVRARGVRVAELVLAIAGFGVATLGLLLF